MSQTRAKSLVEQALNTASGFFISLAVWSLVIKPLWDIDVHMGDNLAITAIFTVMSIARGYVWRRLFNRFF